MQPNYRPEESLLDQILNSTFEALKSYPGFNKEIIAQLRQLKQKNGLANATKLSALLKVRTEESGEDR